MVGTVKESLVGWWFWGDSSVVKCSKCLLSKSEDLSLNSRTYIKLDGTQWCAVIPRPLQGDGAQWCAVIQSVYKGTWHSGVLCAIQGLYKEMGG